MAYRSSETKPLLGIWNRFGGTILKLLRAIILVVIFVTLNFAICFAKTDSPEQLAVMYFEAMKTEGLTKVAHFIHPEALIEFKSMMLPIYEYEIESGSRQFTDLSFGNQTSIADIKAMAPESFMNNFMNIVAIQTGTVKIDFENIEVLGSVIEGNNRHVLTRMTIGAGELNMKKLEVLSFRPYNDGWKLQLNGEVKGMAKVLRANLVKK
jgi:hypothetical protein